jgi:hypothetical protein
MRQEILAYVQTLVLGSVTVSSELPWVENGVPLYLKNLKKVYVDIDNVVTEPFISALNGLSISNEITSVRLYFACDAKVLLPNYSDIVNNLKTARNAATISGVQRREVNVTTSVENDVLVTELEYRFIKLLT